MALPTYSDNGGGIQTLKDFQLTEDIKSKRDISYGKKIAEYVTSTIGVNQGYFFSRNSKFQNNRNWANGTVDVYTMFADRYDLNGKQNYINLSYESIKIIQRIVSSKVSQWMQRREKIQVTCTDPLSIQDKQDNYEQAEFVLYNKERLAKLEQESGVPMVSPEQFVPQDKDDLDRWKIEGNKLPEEIEYETVVNNILASAGWFDILKERKLNDFAQVGLGGAYVYMDEYGVVNPEYIEPENLFYSYSKYPDFRDTAWRGFIKSMKISEVRRKYGKQFGGKLSEEEIWQIAQTAQDYQKYDKLIWVDYWSYAFLRPYDEWNVDVVFFWLKSLDNDGYVVTTTKGNKSTIVKKSTGRPMEMKDNEEFVDDDYWNIYKGAYVRSTGTMLEWGLDNNMIRPQDPKESGNVEFPICIFMPENFDMRNTAIPDRCKEPATEMIGVRLRMQQLIAKLVPIGAAVNVDAMQELDLGLAQVITPIEAEKIWRQTGTLYYRGRDAEGNPIPVPIQELANSGFLNQMKGLIELYSFHYQVLKDELGEDPNLMTAAAQPRVTSDNIQVSQQQGNAATDVFYRGYLYLMEDMAKKIACLLSASIKYGAKVYRSLTKEEVDNRRFSTKFLMMPDQYKIQKFEAFMNAARQRTPDLILFIDPFKLMRVAEENIKLAELLFMNGQKKMLQHQAQMAQQQSEQNAQIQIASSQAKAKSDAELAQLQASIKMQEADAKGQMDKQNALLTSILKMYELSMQNGVSIPAAIQPLANQVLANVAIPISQQNQQMTQAIIEQQVQPQQEQGSPEMEQQEQQMMM
jgi:hypothetical protein